MTRSQKGYPKSMTMPSNDDPTTGTTHLQPPRKTQVFMERRDSKWVGVDKGRKH